MLTCVMCSNLLEMSVQLFTALNGQLVTTCPLIFPKMGFPVLVTDASLFPTFIVDLYHMVGFTFTFLFQPIMQD